VCAARHQAVGRAVVGREAQLASDSTADLVRTTRDGFFAEAR